MQISILIPIALFIHLSNETKIMKMCRPGEREYFSCKRENTLESVGFATLWTLIWHVTVNFAKWCPITAC